MFLDFSLRSKCISCRTSAGIYHNHQRHLFTNFSAVCLLFEIVNKIFKKLYIGKNNRKGEWMLLRLACNDKS